MVQCIFRRSAFDDYGAEAKPGERNGHGSADIALFDAAGATGFLGPRGCLRNAESFTFLASFLKTRISSACDFHERFPIAHLQLRSSFRDMFLKFHLQDNSPTPALQ
jgi:hypothetical protein